MFPVSFGGLPPLPANSSYASEASRASYPATAAAHAGAGLANYPASAVAHASWQVSAGLLGNSDHNEEISLSGSSIKNMDEGSVRAADTSSIVEATAWSNMGYGDVVRPISRRQPLLLGRSRRC